MGKESAELKLESLRADFGATLVDALAKRIAEGIALEIDPALFAEELGLVSSLDHVAAFLGKAAQLQLLEEVPAFRCTSCGNRLLPDAVERGECPCGTNFRAEGINPVSFKVYKLAGKQTRDIPWLVVIHGMNTAGTWQEDFSWRIATKLKYSAPVFIYKYGFLRFGVLARRRHLALARQLGRRLTEAFRDARENGYDEPPDVVIHSFGSQLFVLVLGMEEFRALRFGRVIAAGAIVDPNYNWTAMIDSGRIDAVLNHRGGSDWAVPFAQLAIPRTGPGARKGFSDPKALNLLDPGFGHSDCLALDTLSANLKEGGAWDRFLRLPVEDFRDQRCREPIKWRPIPRLITFSARMILIIIAIGLAIFLASLFVYGVIYGAGPILSYVAGFI